MLSTQHCWLRISLMNISNYLATCDCRFSKPLKLSCETCVLLVVIALSNRKLAGSDPILLAWDLALCWVVFNVIQHLISLVLVMSLCNPFGRGPFWRSHIVFFLFSTHVRVLLCSNKHAAGPLCSEFQLIGIDDVQREHSLEIICLAADRCVVYLNALWKFL